DAPIPQAPEHLEEAVNIHGLGQAVLDRLPDERILERHLNIAGRQRLAARQDRGKGRRQEILRPHADERSGDALPIPHPIEEKRSLSVPAPARREHGRREERLNEQVSGRVRMEIVEDLGQLEAVLKAERENDRLLVGGGLKLETKAAAKTLSEGK